MFFPPAGKLPDLKWLIPAASRPLPALPAFEAPVAGVTMWQSPPGDTIRGCVPRRRIAASLGIVIVTPIAVTLFIGVVARKDSNAYGTCVHHDPHRHPSAAPETVAWRGDLRCRRQDVAAAGSSCRQRVQPADGQLSAEVRLPGRPLWVSASSGRLWPAGEPPCRGGHPAAAQRCQRGAARPCRAGQSEAPQAAGRGVATGVCSDRRPWAGA